MTNTDKRVPNNLSYRENNNNINNNNTSMISDNKMKTRHKMNKIMLIQSLAYENLSTSITSESIPYGMILGLIIDDE